MFAGSFAGTKSTAGMLYGRPRVCRRSCWLRRPWRLTVRHPRAGRRSHPAAPSRARAKRCAPASTICSAGDAQSSVQALTYAAEGGETLAQWKLGSIYAAGEVVPRNDVLAYKYFEELVDNYDEDETDRARSRRSPTPSCRLASTASTASPAATSNPTPSARSRCSSSPRPDSATPTAQYHLARMFIDGAGGLEQGQAARRQMAGARRREGPSRRTGAARPSAVPRRRRAAPGARAA